MAATLTCLILLMIGDSKRVYLFRRRRKKLVLQYKRSSSLCMQLSSEYHYLLYDSLKRNHALVLHLYLEKMRVSTRQQCSLHFQMNIKILVN